MPFGLCNVPMTFIRVVNDVFRPFIDDFSIIYLYDILVFNCTWEDHVMHVGKAFSLLKRDKIYVKISECEFGKTSLVYLGYIIGDGQLKIDPSKVEVIMNWHKPITAIEVRSFLGVVQYWRKFIANFSYIPTPLDALTSVE